jgi:hypothetical protein
MRPDDLDGWCRYTWFVSPIPVYLFSERPGMRVFRQCRGLDGALTLTPVSCVRRAES